ncbi:MAG: PP2C family protein-serine/threonine phosphatase, partial [Chloroflexota bacterium]|nr:PP2C family protein-serine/threonine phosphatase [Chloroflexota bacterium]
DNRMQAGLFTPDDLDLLTTIAASAAVAIENARLYQLAVEKGRMERELQMALEVQSSLIPQETPQIDGWDFAAIWRPARVVGGDYYDFIPIAGTPAPQHGILIADVSDKGMAAALFMALTRSTVRASLLPGHTPAECITQANRLISADAAHGMFVTCFYAQLDPGKGELVYVNAGHNPPLVYSAAQNRLSELTRTGAALGMIDDQIYGQRTILLSRGDFILLYTDGISEAMNTAQEQFGTDRLERTVLANRDAASAEIIAAVERAVNDFIGSAAVFDDITALVVKRI